MKRRIGNTAASPAQSGQARCHSGAPDPPIHRRSPRARAFRAGSERAGCSCCSASRPCALPTRPATLARRLWPERPSLAVAAPLVLAGTLAWSTYSTLLLFDALEIEKGPIATVQVPIRLRFGLHGNFAPSEEIGLAA